jgi:hypothetical protein
MPELAASAEGDASSEISYIAGRQPKKRRSWIICATCGGTMSTHAVGDFFQHVAREDVEELRLEIVQRHEAAAVGEVAVELLQLGRDFEVVDGGERAGVRVLERIDVELEVVFEEPAEAFEDPAGELGVVLFLEQLGQAGRAHHDADPFLSPPRDIGGEPVVFEVVGNHDRHPAGGEQVGAGEEIAAVHVVAAGQQVAHGQLEDGEHRLARDIGVGGEFFQRALEHVQVHVGRRAEAAALDQHGLLVERLRRL